MVIAIDLTSLSYHMTGIERYAACVSLKMLEQDSKNTYHLIFRQDVFEDFKQYIDNERVHAHVLTGKNKLIFYQLILPFKLYKIKADRYVFFAFTSPILFWRKGIFNTIHDMGAWDSAEALTLFQKIYFRFTYWFASKISQGIITVSEFSKGRISKILKCPENKISVVYSAVYEGVTRDYGIPYEAVQNKYSLPAKYIMTLSTLEPRKNMSILLEAFSNIQDKVDYDLVLVGRKGWKMDEVLDKYSGKERIHITGFVADEHVSVIYKNAMCFVFPSLYEGFGLPPVEALALGTPVIASDAASIPEVLMDSATYFANSSEKELEALLEALPDNIDSMPKGLNEYQQSNYDFGVSARKILDLISV